MNNNTSIISSTVRINSLSAMFLIHLVIQALCFITFIPVQVPAFVVKSPVRGIDVFSRTSDLYLNRNNNEEIKYPLSRMSELSSFSLLSMSKFGQSNISKRKRYGYPRHAINKLEDDNGVVNNQNTDNDNKNESDNINPKGSIVSFMSNAKKLLKRNFSNSSSKLSTLSKTSSKSLSSSGSNNNGELFIFMEISMLLFILRGKVPFLHDLIQFLCGPILFIAGLIISVTAIRALNTTSFTPYTKPISPAKGGKMVTSGIYSWIRHPVYAGNLCCFIGLSIMSGSAMRLFLSFLYYLVVEYKTRQEEDGMENEFGVDAYENYRNQVEGKFIPSKDLVFQAIKKISTSENDKDNNENEMTSSNDGDDVSSDSV